MLAAIAPNAAFTAPATGRINEVWDQKQTEAAGIVWRGNHTVSPLPHETLKSEELPDAFTWCNKDGVNYCTPSLNQPHSISLYSAQLPSSARQNHRSAMSSVAS